MVAWMSLAFGGNGTWATACDVEADPCRTFVAAAARVWAQAGDPARAPLLLERWLAASERLEVLVAEGRRTGAEAMVVTQRRCDAGLADACDALRAVDLEGVDRFGRFVPVALLEQGVLVRPSFDNPYAGSEGGLVAVGPGGEVPVEPGRPIVGWIEGAEPSVVRYVGGLFYAGPVVGPAEAVFEPVLGGVCRAVETSTHAVFSAGLGCRTLAWYERTGGRILHRLELSQVVDLAPGDDGTVVVAEPDRVAALDVEGAVLWEVGSARPLRAVSTGSGHAWVSDGERSLKLDLRDGSVLAERPGTCRVDHGLLACVGRDGLRVYARDDADDVVLALDVRPRTLRVDGLRRRVAVGTQVYTLRGGRRPTGDFERQTAGWPRRIEGRVVRDGQPVVDAVVQVGIPLETPGLFAVVRSVRSDEHGRFRVQSPVRGPRFVRAVAGSDEGITWSTAARPLELELADPSPFHKPARVPDSTAWLEDCTLADGTPCTEARRLPEDLVVSRHDPLRLVERPEVPSVAGRRTLRVVDAEGVPVVGASLHCVDLGAPDREAEVVRTDADGRLVRHGEVVRCGTSDGVRSVPIELPADLQLDDPAALDVATVEALPDTAASFEGRWTCDSGVYDVEEVAVVAPGVASTAEGGWIVWTSEDRGTWFTPFVEGSIERCERAP